MDGETETSDVPIRVMIVDDDPLVRDMLRLLLRRERDMLVVGEAVDAEEAVAHAGETRPDVVLMDVQLPTLDGIEAIRRLKTGRTSPGVIMLTLYFERAVEALAAGAYDCLCKACPRTQLLGCIRQAAATARADYPAT